MGEIVLLGLLVAASLVALVYRFGVRTVFGYGALADLAAMAMLALLFHGTFAGMSVAIIAGLFFSGAIWVIRRHAGYRTWDWKARGWREVPPDPLVIPVPKPKTIAAVVALYVLTYCAVVIVTLMIAGALTGLGIVVIAPLALVAGLFLTPILIRRVRHDP